jgi:adenylate cyclase
MRLLGHGVRLRWLPNVRYGTDRYPEKIARRLRATNITAWLMTLAMLSFAVRHPADPDPVSLSTATAIAATPLLHRFSPLLAPIALIGLAFSHVVRITLAVGTGDGIFMALLTAAPLSIFLFGVEHVRVAILGVVTATMLAIWLRFTVPFNTGEVPEEINRLNFSINFLLNISIGFAVVYYVARQASRAETIAEREYERSERLLANILPPDVAARLKDEKQHEIADAYPDASVLFADIAGFTQLASSIDPKTLVAFLNDLYSRIDALVERHALEKIKTTGDAYMVVAGLPVPTPDHAGKLADFALEVRDTLGGLTDPRGLPVRARIGIASGPVVAGIVGTRKFFYDVWGDAVNTASRMETTGPLGKIQVSQKAHELLANTFEFEERGSIMVRGKGKVPTWLLLRRKAGPPQVHA